MSVMVRDSRYNDCPDGQLGMCAKTKYLGELANGHQCEKHRAPASDELASRDVTGCYPADQVGKLAADGSRLDRIIGAHVISYSWRSAACERLQCVLPQFLRMVPREHRYCSLHGRLTPPAENLYPLVEGSDEWRRAEAREWEVKRKSRRVPSLYSDVTIERSRRTPAIDVAERLTDGDEFVSRGLIIEGGPGCGKTHALRCVERRLVCWSGGHVVFHHFPKLITLLLGPERDETLEAALEADDLIIDDLGASYLKPGGMAVGLIEEIVLHREQELYPMIASTNLTPKKLRSTFGERIFDRLRGPWGAWLKVDGPSLRRKDPKPS